MINMYITAIISKYCIRLYFIYYRCYITGDRYIDSSGDIAIDVVRPDTEGAINWGMFNKNGFARVISEENYGPFKAVIPQVEGTAYITGKHTFIIDPQDPMKEGFILR